MKQREHDLIECGNRGHPYLASHQYRPDYNRDQEAAMTRDDLEDTVGKKRGRSSF